MSNLAGRDILSVRSFSRADFTHLFEVCDEFAPIVQRRQVTDVLAGKILAVAFYQPSTRTRLATEAAMLRLGGRVLGFSDVKTTRAGDFFQESIKDTVHMLGNYADVIAMRHYEQGAPAEAARWASVPVINCGDGWGEHPTQVMADLYTMWKEFGRLDGLNIMCVGDLRMRTMRSLALAAGRFSMRITWVAPPEMAPTEAFRREARAAGAELVEAESVEAAIHQVDVVYLEAIRQPDHGGTGGAETGDTDRTPARYRLTLDLLKEKAQSHVIVLHSLPRLDEVPTEIDDSPYQRYWVEGLNGVVVRMGLLAQILGAV